MIREAVFGALFCLEMHLIDIIWLFTCYYYRQFVIEEKYGFNKESVPNFCVGMLFNDFLLMLLRNASYTIVATLLIFYCSTYLSEIVYLLVIAAATNLVVLIDCFGVMQL